MTGATQLGLFALGLSAERRAELIEQLAPIARELGQRAGPAGVTVADLRHTAAQRGMLPPKATGRELAFLGAVMKRAGLRRTPLRRRSFLRVTHGNLNTVWTLP